MTWDILTIIAIACIAWAAYSVTRRAEYVEALVFAAFGFALMGRWDWVATVLALLLFAGAIYLRWREQQGKGRVP